MRARAAKRLSAAALLVLGAGGLRAEEGSLLGNLFRYGGTTVPPSQPAEVEDAYCPPVDVADGGAALRLFGGRAGDGSALRSQITLGRLARECARLADGSVSVKVGVEGQVLLGPAGAPGRFEAPVQIAIKAGGKIVATRARRVAVAIRPGEAQGVFSLVEENLIVPAAAAKEYDIEVGLATGSGPRKRKVTAPAFQVDPNASR